MRRILCVEDAQDQRLLIQSGLADYSLSFAESVREAIRALETGRFSLATIDLLLPDGSGLDVLAFLRNSEKHKYLPVIVLTGKVSLSDKTAAFALGADDYLVKPFDPKELKLRVDAKLRRIEELERRDEVYRLGSLVLNPSEQTVSFAGQDYRRVAFTSLEFRILATLMKKPGLVFTRDSLVDSVWGSGTRISSRTVDSHIAHIRQKIEGSSVTIETVFGTGYKLSESGREL